MKRLFSLLSVLFLFAACSTYIPELEGSVNGTAMYKDQPLEGVEVVITPGGNSFVTKSDGTYTFENLTAETYTLTFKKKGYKTVTKNVKISAGLCVQVDVNLDIDGNLVTADTDILNFGKETKIMTFNIVNQLDKVVSWEIREDNIPEWASFKSLSGDIPSNSQNMVSVTVDRSKVKGEKDSFSMDIDLSTGNTLSVKVNVEAGKVGKVEPELYDIGYDYAVIQFTMMENCVGFYAGVDNTSTRPSSDIKEYGVYYTDDENLIKFYCEQYPGQLHFLYVIPVNKYGQEGEMEVFEVPLKSEPEPEIVYTALKDIKSPGTYNVKDAYVAYADGWRCILTDDGGYTLFYVYFDSSYTAANPKTGDILKLSGEVKKYHNMLEFTNPEFTVTGSAGFNEIIASDAIDRWNKYLIDDGSDMTSYCSLSSPGIRPVSLRGTLSKASNGDYYNLAVGGTDVVGNLMNSDAAYFHDYVGKTIDFDGVAVGYNEYMGNHYIDIIVTDIEEVYVPQYNLDMYCGYWDAEAYDIYNKEYVRWENMYLTYYTDDATGETDVYLYGFEGYNFERAIGCYEDGQLLLLGSWGSGSFIFGDDEENIYRAYFFPIYADEEDNISLIQPSRKDYPTAVLSIMGNDPDAINFLMLAGDHQYPDENGNTANGFVFYYENISDPDDYGWFAPYKNVTFTRSQNPPTEASYARSQSGRKPRNYVEIDQSHAPRTFDARRFLGKVPRSL